MTRLAYLLSSARHLTLEDGSTHPGGCFVEQVLAPLQQFEAAGFEVTVITPDGRPPAVEPYDPAWFFHSPREDMAFLASVIRTFADDAENIRMTLHQYVDLGLTAARRVDALLQARGWTALQAHRTVSAAARVAWREDTPFAKVLADHGWLGLTLGQVQDAVACQRADAQRLADERYAEVLAIAGFSRPVALSSLTASDMSHFDALFVPGGYGPMADLSDNPDAGRLLVALHHKDAPITALGHGAAVLLSAPDRADGLWLFDGYRMTSITDEEEDQTRAGQHGMAWRLDVALQNAGAVFDDGPSAWTSHVVVDRNVITGQNPASTGATAGALLRRLGSPAPACASSNDSPASGETSPSTTRTPSETVQAFFAAASGRDVEAAVAVLSPVVSVTVHPLRVTGTGVHTLHHILSDLLLSFPDLRINVDRVITTGPVLTALVRAGGTQAAEYAGAINLNRHVEINQAWRFVVADGVITEVTAYWCQAQLYRRLAIKRYREIAIA